MLRILHAFKVYSPEVDGGIPEIIRILTTGLSTKCHGEILVSRVRGWGRSGLVDDILVRRISSLLSLWSMPIAPSYPLWLSLLGSRVDVVDFHAPFPLVDLAISLWFPRNTALIVHWHSEIVEQQKLLPLVRFLIRRTLNRADRVIVSHQAMIDKSPFLRPIAAKCKVIPFGIDVGYWAHLTPVEHQLVDDLRAQYPRLVIATGRLVPYKGFDILIDAMAETDGDLIIAGTGPLECALHNRAKALGIAHRVHFAGYVERSKLKCMFHACRVFTLPSVSENETFGIVQLEAMACGKPIVNTWLPTGVPWVARDGIEARTVAPRSALELASALRHLLDHQGEADTLGSLGLKRVTNLFSQESFLESTLGIYLEAIETRRRIVKSQRITADISRSSEP
jgi:glycosyltransferase involved in cell wall biosynthesis